MATIVRKMLAKDLPEALRGYVASTSLMDVTVRELPDRSTQDRRTRMKALLAWAGRRAEGAAVPKEESIASMEALREQRKGMEASGLLEPFNRKMDRIDR